jgi:ketosteroid isomerase-like protein
MTVAVDVVLSAFHAVEERDEQALARLYHPQIEFCWPESLPYGPSRREHDMLAAGGRTWAQAWDPFQGADERKMDPRVVAASEDEVVVLWQQRGRGADGQYFDMPVLGLYSVRDGKLARAQMFYFDTVPVLEFLNTARPATAPGP